MRTLIALSFLATPLFATQWSELPVPLVKAISAHQNPVLESTKSEVLELVRLCGPGVFRGIRSPNGDTYRNNCSYQVDLDSLFFTPLKDKTGLLHDPNWAYQDGVTFYEANVERAVPDNFDLRDLMKNGIPDIRRQQCGDCWAWSTHHGLEIARAVHEQQALDHSSQSVLSCSKKGSCNGGYMSAVDFLIHGLPFEPEFPYTGKDSPCKYSSSQISQGWTGKIIASPNVGTSLEHSLYFQHFPMKREGTKVSSMMEAMVQWNSPLVVTVSSYSISGPGVYDSCSNINSGGNHMVAIVGWEIWNGKRVAHVWNSHGKEHGENGVSRIVWECGDGKLNRGLGVSAKIVQYKAPCSAPNAEQVYFHNLAAGGNVQIGKAQIDALTRCTWTPTDGLANPDQCVTQASPTRTTEYHLTATNACGTSSSMTLVNVWSEDSGMVHTPFGDVPYPSKK